MSTFTSSRVLAPVGTAGKLFAFGLDVFRGLFRRPFQLREFLQQAWFIASVTIVPTALVAIPFGAVIALQVGGDGRAARARDQQRGRDRARLPDHGQDGRGPGDRLGAELLDQSSDLKGDHRAERDRDQGGRDDRHGGDEPGLLDELAQLEGPAEHAPAHVEAEGEQLAGGPDRGEDPGGDI